jgi:Protein of unknown function (DUF2510)
MSLLTEQPPPRKGAKAGYYPDPLGSGRSRYWDGSNWTPTLGPMVPEGTARGKSVPPPTKVCPHCRARAETFESTCPSCGRAYGMSRGAIAGIIGATVAVLVLFVGGCAAFVLVVDDLEVEGEISRAEYDSIEVGDTESAVRGQLGSPTNTSEVQEAGGTFKCIYYDDEDADFDEDDYFELCFRGGILLSKQEFD